MSWYKGGIEGLIDKEEIKKKINKKKNPLETTTQPNCNLDDYLRNGWKVEKTLKSRVHLSKEKSWCDKFQDLVWVMLAEMGFAWMNGDPATFKLDKGDGSHKQIDVFGIDNEDVVVFAECKAAKSDTPRPMDFDYALNDIREYRNKVTKELKSYFETKPKYIFLFCTSNYIVGEKDKDTMKRDGIVWLDKSRVEYYINLTSQIGVLAKYQFLGEVLAGSDIPNLKDNKVPAIRAKMGGEICYSMMLHPSVLLKMGYVLHRTENSTHGTYQRYVQKKRLNEVSSYIKGGGFFPNSILLNFDNELHFDKGEDSIQHDENIIVGTVTLPQKYRSAFIIDGQHRLYGYANTEKKDTDVIPVVAFEKLSPEIQTNMFVDINTKSVQVKRNLLEALNGEIYWDSPNERYALTALNSVLALDLDKNNDSPLFGLLTIGDEKKEKKGKITLTYFIDNALAKENFFVSGFNSKGKATAYGPFYDGDLTDKSREKAYKIIVYFYSKIRDRCPEQWDVLLSNVGVSTLAWMLKEFLDERQRVSSDIFSTKNAKHIIGSIEGRVNLLCTELSKKEPNEVKSYVEGKLGYGGVNKASRCFERLMFEADPSFNPEGLEEWIIEQSGKYSEETAQILNELTPTVINLVEDKLKEKYGNEYYFSGELSEGLVHKIVQKKTAQRIKLQEIEREGGDTSEILSQSLLELSDIRSIVLKFWRELEFEQLFKDRRVRGDKEETTKWLDVLASIQNKVARNVGLSATDYQSAKEISEWFCKVLGEDK